VKGMTNLRNDLLKAFIRCRILDARIAQTAFGVSQEELDSMVEEKILVTEKVQKDTETLTYYVLTDKGEKVAKEKLSYTGEVYRGFILEHDLALMEFYLSLTTEEREGWLTRDDMTKQYRLPGTIDGAYVNKEGVLEGVEVLSRTAKPSAVEKAESFLNQTDIKKMNYLTY
jgi:DNA-binding PadR family transcriptional regulator